MEHVKERRRALISRVRWIAGLFAVILFMIVLRVLAGGYAEEARARQHREAGDINEAIAAYDRTLHWYLPGSPTVNRASRALKSIAEKAEVGGDIETALRTWRVLRSGFYAATWLVTPGRKIIDECDENIARLVAVKAAAKSGDPQAGGKAHDKEMAILKREVGPKVGWSVAALIGFFAWIASVILFIFRALGPGDEFYRKKALIYGLFFLVSYALWMIALSRA